jgi:acetyl esterase/lipase
LTNGKELAKLPASTVLTIDPADHIEMRKWLVEEYMTWPRAPVAEARSRVILNVQSETIPITYGEGGQFAVQVHVPKTEAGLRPALIMYHGGGWIHGFPNVDEGNKTMTA